uniref:Serpentine receptor class gamma n=1 Tax=Panagrellus redivivus TaxID=6233 RepID=A0A7E4UU80_PANRE
MLVPMFKALGNVQNFWTNVPPFLTYYGTYSCELIGLCLTFNRMTVFLLKNKYASFWRCNLKYFIAVAILVPLIPTIPIFTHQYAIYELPSGVITWDKLAKLKWKTSYSSLCIFAITCVPSLIINLWLCTKLVTGHAYGDSASPTAGTDFRLWILTVVMFLATVVQTIVQLSFNIPGVDDYYLYIMCVQFAVVDLTSVGPSWAILWTSSIFRSEVLEVMKLGGPKVRIENNGNRGSSHTKTPFHLY